VKNVTIHNLVAYAFIANPNKKRCVDNKNNNRLDNNISNLRWVTRRENCMNASMKSNNSSGVIVVCFNKQANKWRAYISIDGISIHLGLFDTQEEATIARVQRATQVFGQYKNASEGINHGAKPMAIRKPKNVVQPIVKPNFQQIYDNIVKLKHNYKNDLLKLQNKLQTVLNM
jgi:hypothetical protein